ncbi:MAG: hypothetical protein M3R27_08925 [Bacteroidota bacterium]|nr:hypothetical protein [Bacteroidota bacterium]
MGQKNQYLDKVIPALYRKQMLDVMIYTFIEAQRSLVPGLSVSDSAKSFLMSYDIDEGDMTLEKIKSTYFRIQKDLFHEKKTRHSD